MAIHHLKSQEEAIKMILKLTMKLTVIALMAFMMALNLR